MRRFFNQTCERYFTRKLFAALKYYAQVSRRNKRLTRRTTNEYRRKTLQSCFDVLRHTAHKNFVSKLEYKQHEFRAELEAKILVQH
mmetsp:Transcript_31377/g.41561  ORF Transcript_31377/g.41561 Transcript_31377/m.41561 type:complete len:86 (+) Transcript_31377:656-913(+)